MADYTLKCTGEQLDAAVEKANSAFVALNNKLNKDDVYDGLDNEDASKALSARQGKLLKDWVDNCITYNEDIDIGSHSFTMGSVFTVGSESSVYTQTVPGSISLKNPIGTLGIGTYSLTVNGTTIYWPTVSGDPNGKYLALRSDIPSIDTSLSATSTNAVQNKVINSTISELSYQLAMVRENLFQTVLSEIDYTEDFATLYPIPDTLSDVDGTHRVLFSETQLREVAGNSVVLNQHLHNEITSYGTEGHEYGNNSTLSINNGKMTITATGVNQSYFGVGFNDLSSLQNHKVLCIAYISSISVTNSFKDITFSWGLLNVNDEARATTSNKYVYALGTWDSNKNATYLNINGITAVKGDYIVVDNYMIIDLTQMFGAGNEPTTVAEFKRLFPEQYYEYSTGEVINTTASGVKVNGYNLFDEETEIGTYDTNTGEKKVDDRQIRSKNDIEIFPNNTYAMEYDGNKENVYIWACLLDESKTIINGSLWGEAYSIATNFRRIAGSHISANSFVVPSNARYLRFYITIPYGKVYNNDICFHLSTLRTGYAPYKEPKAISFASTELLGAGDAHDTIELVEGDKVAGIQRYNLIQVKRVGTVDLGTLAWDYSPTPKRFSSDSMMNRIKIHTNYSKISNLVCSKYKVCSPYTIEQVESTDKAVAIGGNGYSVNIKDTSYTDATAFKTAMNGVILNYELATPTRTTIAENLTFEEVSATIEQGGSIETIYETLAPNCTAGFVVKKTKE